MALVKGNILPKQRDSPQDSRKYIIENKVQETLHFRYLKLLVIGWRYPPGNESMSHLGKRKFIFQTALGKGYVSSLDGYPFGYSLVNYGRGLFCLLPGSNLVIYRGFLVGTFLISVSLLSIVEFFESICLNEVLPLNSWYLQDGQIGHHLNWPVLAVTSSRGWKGLGFDVVSVSFHSLILSLERFHFFLGVITGISLYRLEALFDSPAIHGMLRWRFMHK